MIDDFILELYLASMAYRLIIGSVNLLVLLDSIIFNKSGSASYRKP